VIIGLQGQYDISVSLSGTRSYIYLAMLLDHGDFRSLPRSADILRIGGHVSKVPMSEIAGLGLILSCQHAVSLFQVLAYLPI
jgi:hypothetical protein